MTRTIITLEGPVLDALMQQLDPYSCVEIYKLRIAREGDLLMFKVNEDVWSTPFALTEWTDDMTPADFLRASAR